MKKIRKLTWEELKHSYSPSDFLFKTTDELECLDDVIGQERAKKAMEFGLSVKAQGYNIYMSGELGTGKTTFAKIYAKKTASQRPVPSDWCYVYNFKDNRVPKALCFDPGDGKRFRDDMIELIEYLTQEIPHIYAKDEHVEQNNHRIDKYHKEKELRIEELQQYAKDVGFVVRVTTDKIAFIPLGNSGESISENEFETLSPKEQQKMEDLSIKLQQMATEIVEDIKELEQECIQEIEDLEYDIGLRSIGYYIKQLKEKYKGYSKVQEYLRDLQQDILDNIKIFLEENEEETSTMASLLPWVKEKNIKAIVRKYKVNLLVDHSESETAPVILDFNATYNKILGELEYDNEFGTLSTDYMKIKPGLFHRANGGYLILQAEEMLGNYEAWNTIKRVLKTRKIYIENPEGISVTTIATLSPEPIDIDVKVILIGSTQIYQLLYKNDFEFKRLFRVRADFDREMHYNQKNTSLIARFIKTYGNQQSLLPFSTTAVSTIVRYASRYVENQRKITAEFGWISSIMIEAHTFASIQGARIVDEGHVHLAVEEKRYRASKVEDKMDEQMMNHTIMIETKGSQSGQINALAIYDDGEYCFGKPLKVTATTYQGKSGIINIEKEAKLSGDIHTKGIQVITGYLGQTYAQEFPLSLSCRICFEQNYGQIDGDSASSAELYTILSSLAGIGLKQNIAVTGSVNQHGMIQPVGGVTHKTEGFFKVCEKRGLTGDQGVIIPIQNISDLVLNDDVIRAVKGNEFHIYAISNIQEGLEILCGVPYEQIQQKVKQKLEKFQRLT